MIKYTFFFFLAAFLVACGGDSENQDNTDKVQFEEPKPFVREVILIDTVRPQLDPVCIDIMEKLQMCTTSDTSKLAPCTYEYFRVFDHKPLQDYKGGFIVEMRQGLYGAPTPQIIIVENVNNEYKLANQYLGWMIEMRTTEHGHSELLIGYKDPDVGMVAIRHEWDGHKYEPVDVEEINNHFVKPEMKDSINNIFLPAFSAGH
ncbi:hypothetical protein K6119_05365 [Paracrocinitomix mangrovi]|uniref:hypothetical protein n=1 Tax=Paracrocinitomix mangrovi TaxID=2862509 RepID=UPI001C8F1C5E|nr:hypothetical protein [Paracrocinitomix mangrovi]UKN02942.1 hypothetical protein K6119_05365 [Paracrocinitomix mangrovi]